MRNRRHLWVTLILSLVVTSGLLTWVLVAGYRPKLGLDLAGGTSVVLTAKGKTNPDSLKVAVDIIRSRVDDLGVSEPEITTEGSNNIVVQMPGLDDEQQALDLIGTTAELGFRRVQAMFPAQAAVTPEGETTLPPDTSPGGAGDTPPETTAPPTSAPGDGSGESGADFDTDFDTGGSVFRTASLQTQATEPTQPVTEDTGGSVFRTASLEAQTTETAPPVPEGTLPPGVEIPEGALPPGVQVPGQSPQQAPPLTPADQITPEATIVVPDRDGTLIYQLGPEQLSGRDVKKATAQIQSGSTGLGGWIVSLKFTGKGDELYEKLTGEAACAQTGDPTRQIAIVLDNEVVSAPQVAEDVQCNQGISGGGIITLGGSESDDTSQQEEAKELASLLKYGSLPVRLETSNIETVSPTLGEDSLEAGVIAGIIGLILVAIYVLVFYRFFGLYVIFGLVVFGVLIFVFVSLMSEFYGLTLTLAGLAAIVVSIGINADSAIVIIERIKDEVHEGRTMRTSTERGYKRAFGTILAADTVSILAAASLYFLTVGSVRGFALMLGTSTVLDVVITILIIRPMVLLSADSWLFRHERLLFWRRPGRPSAAPAADGSLEAAT